MQKIRNLAQLVCGVSVAALISSCAAMMSGTSQTIYVQAVDKTSQQRIPGASCVVKDSKNTTYVVQGNPGSVFMNRGQGVLQTSCSAPGYIQNAVGTGSTFNAWTIGNIIFPLGVVVDVVTGAAEKYPDHITVLMAKVANKNTAKPRKTNLPTRP